MQKLKEHILKTNHDLITTINEGIEIMNDGYIHNLEDAETRKLFLRTIESGKEAVSQLKTYKPEW